MYLYNSLDKDKFIATITTDPADKFANTFVAKANARNLWESEGCMCVVNDAGELMGASIITLSKRKPLCVNFQLLHVFSKHRRLGVGKLLVEESVSYAYLNAKYFRVSAEKDAVKFYEKCGFVFQGIQKSGTYLSICEITDESIAKCNFDVTNPYINNKLFSNARGSVVKTLVKPENVIVDNLPISTNLETAYNNLAAAAVQESSEPSERDLRIVIVMAGAGSAGKSTTTLAYSEGVPDERSFEFDWIDRSGKDRKNKVKYTIYDNCALTGNHKSGTDVNNAPAMVKAAFDKCVKERDVVIVDGFCSSPRWVDMINDNKDYDFHVVFLHFDFTAEQILTRLAKRRGVDKEDIREKMYGKSVPRPSVLLRRFDENATFPFDIIDVFYEDSTETIVELIDDAVNDLWEEYGYELEDI